MCNLQHKTISSKYLYKLGLKGKDRFNVEIIQYQLPTWYDEF